MGIDKSFAGASESAQEGLPFRIPPDFAGVLFNSILKGSYIQLYETAIPATIAMLAGVTGRAYRTPTGKDLSLYMILVAPSGVGKDAIHEGIPAMIKIGCSNLMQDPNRFVRAEDFVSGAALHRTVLEAPGFLNLQGEFGRKLKRMANATDAPMTELRTKMTRIYSSSWMEAKSHSKETDSIPGVSTPALSFLGETTPQTFYDVLTPDMMEDGFLSRFVVVFYDGDRPPAVKHRSYDLPNSACLQYWQGMLTYCAHYHAPDAPYAALTVQYDEKDTELMLDGQFGFEETCRRKMNSAQRAGDSFTAAIWNRAHLKAQKIASILAVANNFRQPMITAAHSEWAIDFVMRDVELFQRRKRAGAIGIDDEARERALNDVIDEFLRNGAPPSYKVPAGMRETAVVSYDYLRRKTMKKTCFTSHRLGATAALDQTTKTLMQRGHLIEIQKDPSQSRFPDLSNCFHGIPDGAAPQAHQQ